MTKLSTTTADGVLAATALAGTPSSPYDHGELERGAVIGRYVVLFTLGAGGMGIVFAAYDPELDRKVALKLLHPRYTGGDAPSVDAPRARLLREAQALAKLSHPHIVAIHDVGEHGGSVWLAMEYVDGETLSAWLKQRRTWREVLSVVIPAAKGLAAAHAAGLVHRDIKPDNLMVARDGRVRVMDLGLARPRVGGDASGDAITAEGGAGSTALAAQVTRVGSVVGTPAYMSPEQFRGEPVDARADVFSLCVTLWEALMGERPFAGRTVFEVSGNVLSGTLRPVPSEAYAQRVPGWLRRVCLRGLEVAPERRLASMTALLDALDRGVARARARRWLVGGAAAVVVAAGIGGGAMAYAQRSTRVCMGFEAQLSGVWGDDHRARVQEAFEGTGLVYAADIRRSAAARLDEYTTRWVAARREACEATERGEQSGELLDLRMACLAERLEHVTAAVGVLETADRDVVRRAVETVAGLPRLDRCADIDALTAEQAPPEDPVVAGQVAALDEQLIEASTLGRAGKIERGLELATGASAAADELAYEPLQVRAWLVKGRLLERSGAYTEVEATLERAYASALGLKMMTEAADAALRLVYVTAIHLARPGDGARWAKDAEPLIRAAGAPELEARYLSTMGTLERVAGRYEEARAYLERALALFERTLGPDHPSVARTLANLGKVDRTSGRYAEARGYLERAVAIIERGQGLDHPNLAGALTSLGGVAIAEERYDDAHADLERAVAISERALGPDHPSLAFILTNLGGLALNRKELDEARAYYERALAIWEKAVGPDHRDVAVALSNLGTVAARQGEFADSRAFYERALTILEKALGADHPKLAFPLTGLGKTLLGLEAPAEALPILDRALTIRSAHEGDPLLLVETRFVLARALWDAPPDGGRDRPRARELAELAARACEAEGEKAADKLAEVRAWQSAHDPGDLAATR